MFLSIKFGFFFLNHWNIVRESRQKVSICASGEKKNKNSRLQTRVLKVMPPPPQSPYYSADAEQSPGDLAASKYAIPAADGSTVYAIPLDERAGAAVARRNGTGAQYMFENPVYAGAAPDNGLSGESKTDTARRPPSSHGAAGPTMLDMMMLEQKVNFYKRAAGGLGLLALVLLIGLVVVASSKTGATAATVVCPPPPTMKAGSAAARCLLWTPLLLHRGWEWQPKLPPSPQHSQL